MNNVFRAVYRIEDECSFQLESQLVVRGTTRYKSQLNGSVLVWGRSQILFYAVKALYTTGPTGVYEAVEKPLQIWQTAALFEVFSFFLHCAPIFTVQIFAFGSLHMG